MASRSKWALVRLWALLAVTGCMVSLSTAQSGSTPLLPRSGSWGDTGKFCENAPSITAIEVNADGSLTVTNAATFVVIHPAEDGSFAGSGEYMAIAGGLPLEIAITYEFMVESPTRISGLVSIAALTFSEICDVLLVFQESATGDEEAAATGAADAGLNPLLVVTEQFEIPELLPPAANPGDFGFAALYIDDPDIVALALSPFGEQLGIVKGRDANSEVERISGVVYIAPSGDSLIVRLNENGLSQEAMIGDWILVFENYSVNSVDMAVIRPDGMIDTQLAVPVNPETLIRARALYSLQFSADITRQYVSSRPEWLYQSPEAVEARGLSYLANVGALGITVAGCVLGTVPALGTGPLGFLAFAAACGGLISSGTSAVQSSHQALWNSVYDIGANVNEADSNAQQAAQDLINTIVSEGASGGPTILGPGGLVVSGAGEIFRRNALELERRQLELDRARAELQGIADRRADSDGDGISDADDDCPFTPRTAGRTDGCPDSDGDGVVDPIDDCPLQPGSPEMRGCPPAVSDDDTEDPFVTGFLGARIPRFELESGRYDGWDINVVFQTDLGDPDLELDVIVDDAGNMQYASLRNRGDTARDFECASGRFEGNTFAFEGWLHGADFYRVSVTVELTDPERMEIAERHFFRVGLDARIEKFTRPRVEGFGDDLLLEVTMIRPDEEGRMLRTRLGFEEGRMGAPCGTG